MPNFLKYVTPLAACALLATASAAYAGTTESVTLDDTTGAANWNSFAYPSLCTGTMPHGGPAKTYPICIESIQQAVTDAYTRFAVSGHHNDVYNIYLTSASGMTFDLTAATRQYYTSTAAAYINLTNASYTTIGLLPIGAGHLNVIGSSASSGTAGVTLITHGSIQTIRGYNVNDVRVSYISFKRDSQSITQGTIVPPMVTGQITIKTPTGYPTLAAFIASRNAYTNNGGNGQGLMRAYMTGSPHPTLINSSDNTQIGWDSTTVTCVPSDSTTCTILFLNSSQAVPASYSQSGALACIKYEGAQSAYDFNDNSNTTADGPGNSVSFDNITWQDSSRGDFRNITNPAVTNSQIVPRTLATDCISVPGGGPQFSQPGDPAYNVSALVNNFTATNTGDDTIAIFNDNNTTLGAGSIIENATITGSFARDINLNFSCRVQVYVYGIDGTNPNYNHISNCFSTSNSIPGFNFPTYYGACVTDTSPAHNSYVTPCAPGGVFPSPPL